MIVAKYFPARGGSSLSPSEIIPDREGSPIILMMRSPHADTLDDDGGPPPVCIRFCQN